MEQNMNQDKLGLEKEENGIVSSENEAISSGEKNKKKMKNLISLCILVGGLFIGSLFVDLSQIIKGDGYSRKNLSKSDIFEAEGKTWVAYNEPVVEIKVLSDETCDQCSPDEILVWLRKVMPTIAARKIDISSDEGKKAIEQYNLKSLPSFVFDKSLEKTELYSQAKTVFEEKDGQYVMNMAAVGAPAGKYLELPKINENDATFGNKDSKVKVIVFSDFQCPYCKVFYASLREVMKNYQDKVLFDFKELPLEMHAQANNAALAGECALEQGKFWEYADKVYNSQNDWGQTKDVSKFKSYAATLGLKTADFNKCLDDKKYQDKINADKTEAQEFGISGTPAVFIGDQFEAGAVGADQMKEIIEAQLAK
jgi:protein-disulfide isomerase